MACAWGPEMFRQIAVMQKQEEEERAGKAQEIIQRAQNQAMLPQSEATATDEYDWTRTYQHWDRWEDPEDLSARAEAEKTRLKNAQDHQMACSHDHSAERKIMDMSLKDKLESLRAFRWRGNQFYDEGQYQRAAINYKKALIYYDFCFPEDEETQAELDTLRLTCLANSAACFVKIRAFEEALDHCQQALQMDPDNVKVLFRRAQIYRHQDRFEDAKADLLKTLKVLPHDFQLRREYAILQNKMTAYKTQSRTLGQQIFGGGRTAPPDAEYTDHLPPPRCTGASYTVAPVRKDREAGALDDLYQAAPLDVDAAMGALDTWMQGCHTEQGLRTVGCA